MSRTVAVLLTVAALVVGAATLAPGATAPTGDRSAPAAEAAAAKKKTGKAVGYAHVKPSGKVAKGRSWRVKQANLENPVGFWCFKKLPFKVRSVAVTLDYNGILNGQVPTALAALPPVATHCPAGSQAEVFTGLINPGGLTSSAKLGFFVVFYN